MEVSQNVDDAQFAERSRDDALDRYRYGRPAAAHLVSSVSGRASSIRAARAAAGGAGRRGAAAPAARTSARSSAGIMISAR
jgi:hypothetical protein